MTSSICKNNESQLASMIPIGTVVFMNHVFNSQQWDELTKLVEDIGSQPSLLEEVLYGKGALENKKFSLSLYKFISRQAGVSHRNQSTYTSTLLDIINHSTLMSQINALNKKTMNILRLQLNVMTEGGYVGCHTDYESDNEYFCSVLIRIGSKYTGGHLVVYDTKGASSSVNQEDRTILAMSSQSLHAVEPVTSGVRYTLCLFCG